MSIDHHVFSFGRRRLLAAALILVLMAVPASAWNDTGHMVSAWIAWRKLKPEVRARVAELLRQHPRYRQDLLRDMPEGFADPDLYAFMKAATWPDIVRDRRNPMYETSHHPKWHYIDYPLVAPADREKLHPAAPEEQGGEVNNALKALKQTMADLKSADLDAAKKAEALCWLSHLIGDIHQPLHCTSFFSEQYPEGDRGGNSFLVRSGGEITNLHYLWDDMLGTASARAIELIARNILANPTHQRASLAEMLSHDGFRAWTQESFADCRDITYLGGRLRGAARERETIGAAATTAPATPADGSGTSGSSRRRGSPTTAPALPPSYEDVARQCASLRIALAGYRLADQINGLFGKP